MSYAPVAFMVSLSNHEGSHEQWCGASWFDKLTMKRIPISSQTPNFCFMTA